METDLLPARRRNRARLALVNAIHVNAPNVAELAQEFDRASDSSLSIYEQLNTTLDEYNEIYDDFISEGCDEEEAAELTRCLLRDGYVE